MKKSNAAVVLVIVGSVLIGGCMVYVRVPGVRGQVVDGEGRVVRGAVVEVGEKHGAVEERIVTGEDGRFRAGEKSVVGLRPVFGDVACVPVEVKAVIAGERERWSEPAVVCGTTREVWEKPVEVDVGALRVR